jgi:hypothetical protein
MPLAWTVDSNMIGRVCFGEFGEGLIFGVYGAEEVPYTYMGIALTDSTMTFIKEHEITIDYSKSPVDCLNWIDSYITAKGRTRDVLKKAIQLEHSSYISPT